MEGGVNTRGETRRREAIDKGKRAARRVGQVREAGAILYLIYSPFATLAIALGGTYTFMKLNHVHEETALATACIVAASAFFEHASSEREKLRQERMDAHREQRPQFTPQAWRLVAVAFVIVVAGGGVYYLLGG